MSKILIGVPTYQEHKHCFDEFTEALKKQTLTSDILFVVNNGEDAYKRWIKSKGFNAAENPKPSKEPREHVLSNRKYLRDYALGLNYDYLLLVSSDVIIPGRALELLIIEKKDIIAAPYLSPFKLAAETVIAPRMFKDKGNGEAQLYTYEGMFPGRVEEIGAAGLGCVLISKNALEKVGFEKMPNGKADDIQFYLSARQKGIKAFAHTAVRCVHRPADKKLAPYLEWRTEYVNPVAEIDSEKLFGKSTATNN